MIYFLNVKTKAGDYLHHYERHDSLETVLGIVSDRYLTDPDLPWRWSGYFALRGGELTHLKIKSGTAGIYLRDDIAEIDILSERGDL